MPLVMRGRKRRADPEPSGSPVSPSPSPEPAPQRRRVTPPSEAEAEDDEDDEDNSANTTTTHSDQAVKKLIRLALASEYQRRPLRRTDISDKVLGAHQTRAFRSVFNAAQQHLRYVFGMELVELPARERVTLQQKRAAQKSLSQGQAKAATQWVLRSILPFPLRDPEVLPPAAAPTQAVEGTYTALYSLLVALIMLGGGQVAQAKMERYLRRLGLEDRTPVPGSEKTEKLLKRLEREGYIREIREKATQGEEDVSFIVGPRGKVEVGERGVEGLVKAVYGHLEGEDGDELERRIARSLGLGEKARVVQNEEARRKRGRPRRDAEEEEQQAGASGSEEDEEGEELYE